MNICRRVNSNSSTAVATRWQHTIFQQSSIKSARFCISTMHEKMLAQSSFSETALSSPLPFEARALTRIYFWKNMELGMFT